MILNSKDCFYYFAYGSNLFKKRIRINNPSSIFVGAAQLNFHQFDFAKYSIKWQGAVATIVPNENESVWGAVWKVHNDDLTALDRQEGVCTKDYFPKIVVINICNEIRAACRTYQHTFTPPRRKPNEEIPQDRRPSITYIDCIIKGAIECNLPQHYIDMLRKIPNNGQYASSEIRALLDI